MRVQNIESGMGFTMELEEGEGLERGCFLTADDGSGTMALPPVAVVGAFKPLTQDAANFFGQVLEKMPDHEITTAGWEFQPETVSPGGVVLPRGALEGDVEFDFVSLTSGSSAGHTPAGEDVNNPYTQTFTIPDDKTVLDKAQTITAIVTALSALNLPENEIALDPAATRDAIEAIYHKWPKFRAKIFGNE